MFYCKYIILKLFIDSSNSNFIIDERLLIWLILKRIVKEDEIDGISEIIVCGENHVSEGYFWYCT